jgi:hypothetical protein
MTTDPMPVPCIRQPCPIGFHRSGLRHHRSGARKPAQSCHIFIGAHAHAAAALPVRRARRRHDRLILDGTSSFYHTLNLRERFAIAMSIA